MKNWIAVLFAFGTTGLFIGWLVGASNSPVVYALLPLIFGFFGGFGFSRLNAQVEEKAYKDRLKQTTYTPEEQANISDSLELDRNVEWAPLLWSGLIISFIACSFVGVIYGIDYRSGSNSTLSEVLERNNFNSKDVDADERIALHNALLRLRSYRMSDREIDDIFGETFLPFVRNDSLYSDEVDAYTRESRTLEDKISSLWSGVEASTLSTRGPASSP